MAELDGAGKHIAIIGGLASIAALALVMTSRGGGGTTVVQPTPDTSGDALQLAQVNASRDAFGVLVQGVTGLEAVGVSAARDIHLAEIGQATATTLGRLQVQRDLGVATTQADADVAKARVAADAYTKSAYYQSDAEITVGKANARAATNASAFNMVGNIVQGVGKAVLSLFGF